MKNWWNDAERGISLPFITVKSSPSEITAGIL